LSGSEGRHEFVLEPITIARSGERSRSGVRLEAGSVPWPLISSAAPQRAAPLTTIIMLGYVVYFLLVWEMTR
jgi:hypothetical protein